jgi:hypothetical protein
MFVCEREPETNEKERERERGRGPPELRGWAASGQLLGSF